MGDRKGKPLIDEVPVAWELKSLKKSKCQISVLADVYVPSYLDACEW